MQPATVRTTLASRLRVLGQAYLDRAGAPDTRAAADFARLFEAAGAPCPPYQSRFIAAPDVPERKLAALPNKALTWYRRFGFGSLPGERAADHAGLLLTFSGHVLEADPSPEMLAAYYREHLYWMDEFSERVAVETRHAYYRELAVSTQAALRGYSSFM
jgi:TorA maturation chaperone TorD